MASFLIQRNFPASLASELAREVARATEAWLTKDRHGNDGSTTGPNTVNSNTVNTVKPNTVKPNIAREPAPLPQGRFPNAQEFRRKGPVADLLLRAMAQRLTCAPPSRPAALTGAGPGRILAFSGPPGSGKTSTLVKLAATWTIEAHGSGVPLPVAAILSTDTLRIAAAEQLRTYAMILDLSFEIVETPLALDRALARLRRDHPLATVLIDTPGWSPVLTGGAQLPEAAQPWIGFFASHPEIEQHLVLPATLAAPEWSAAVRRFLPFGVSRLLLTRVDELTSGGGLAGLLLSDYTRSPTARVGPADSFPAACLIPVSCLSCGQTVPDDWYPASAEALTELILTQLEAPPAENLRPSAARAVPARTPPARTPPATPRPKQEPTHV